MATLTVTDSKDFRGDNLSNITDIVYQANAVATFSASQFDERRYRRPCTLMPAFTTS